MKKDTQMPCVVFSHRLHRFHRCCAEGATLDLGTEAGPYGKTMHPNPAHIHRAAICSICCSV